MVNNDSHHYRINTGSNIINKKVNTNLRGKEAIISAKNSKIKVVLIPTDEEVMIARDAYALLKKKGK